MNEEDLKILENIKKTFKDKKANKPFPDYVYDRIMDLCMAHEIKPAATMIEVLSFTSQGQATYQPMLTIAATRSIAQRAGWAGNDSILWSDETMTMKVYNEDKTVPIWGQMTVYKMVQGHRVPFVGPKLYAKETIQPTKPMWGNKCLFMFEKNIEAASLRRAFPEVLSEDAYIPEEAFEFDAPINTGVLDTLDKVKATPAEEHYEQNSKKETVVEAPPQTKKPNNNSKPKTKQEDIEKPNIPETRSEQGSVLTNDVQPTTQTAPATVSGNQGELVPLTDDLVDVWLDSVEACNTPEELVAVALDLKASFSLTPRQKTVLNDARKAKLEKLNKEKK